LTTFTEPAPEPLLDPRFPGEWLAAVGLSLFGPGRWHRDPKAAQAVTRTPRRASGSAVPVPLAPSSVPEAIRIAAEAAAGETTDNPLYWGHGWDYHHQGELPTAADIQDRLNDIRIDPGPLTTDESRWLLFMGQGQNNRAALPGKLIDALERINVEDLRLDRADRPKTTTGSSWMIDESWRYMHLEPTHDSKPPLMPVIETALALLGVYSGHLVRVATWVRHSIAVGWLWPETILDTPPANAWIAGWRRQPRKFEPHAGALGVGTCVKMNTPTFQRWVPIQLEVTPLLGDTAATYLAREPEVGDPVGIPEIAEHYNVDPKEVAATVKATNGSFPPARWITNGKPAWSLAADIEPWVTLYSGWETNP